MYIDGVIVAVVYVFVTSGVGGFGVLVEEKEGESYFSLPLPLIVCVVVLLKGGVMVVFPPHLVVFLRHPSRHTPLQHHSAPPPPQSASLTLTLHAVTITIYFLRLLVDLPHFLPTGYVLLPFLSSSPLLVTFGKFS